MIGTLMDDDLVVVTNGQTGTDRLNKPVYGEVAQTPTRGRLTMSGSVEGDEYVTGRWTVDLPADVVLDVNDAILDLREGRRFTVDGTPDRVSIPGFPALDRVVAVLKYVGSIG